MAARSPKALRIPHGTKLLEEQDNSRPDYEAPDERRWVNNCSGCGEYKKCYLRGSRYVCARCLRKEGGS